MTVAMLIFMVVQLIVLAIMKVVYVARIIEIAIRTTFAPVALADSFSGNFLNSHAISFIRSFAGICIQGVVITVIAHALPILWVGVAVTIDGWVAALGFILEMLVFSLACLVLMFKSGSIAKEALGAR